MVKPTRIFSVSFLTIVTWGNVFPINKALFGLVRENAKVNYLMEEHPSTKQVVFPIAFLDSGGTRLIKWFLYQPNEVFSLLMTGTVQ